MNREEVVLSNVLAIIINFLWVYLKCLQSGDDWIIG
jgi:hypothetical protein